MSTSVVVIGAGVIGLTTALLLQKKGYQVTIVAKYVPGDMNIEYTSPYSGNMHSQFFLHLPCIRLNKHNE
jgi:glycine/D-amino acid oxidase-like deaminating enzyme